MEMIPWIIWKLSFQQIVKRETTDSILGTFRFEPFQVPLKATVETALITFSVIIKSIPLRGEISVILEAFLFFYLEQPTRRWCRRKRRRRRAPRHRVWEAERVSHWASSPSSVCVRRSEPVRSASAPSPNQVLFNCILLWWHTHVFECRQCTFQKSHNRLFTIWVKHKLHDNKVKIKAFGGSWQLFHGVERCPSVK